MSEKDYLAWIFNGLRDEEPEDPRIAREEWRREHDFDPDEADRQAEREAGNE